jgi:hypothetical protein
VHFQNEKAEIESTFPDFTTFDYSQLGSAGELLNALHTRNVRAASTYKDFPELWAILNEFAKERFHWSADTGNPNIIIGDKIVRNSDLDDSIHT